MILQAIKRIYPQRESISRFAIDKFFLAILILGLKATNSACNFGKND